MARCRKKRITERETLLFDNPSGGKFQKPKGKTKGKKTIDIVTETETPDLSPIVNDCIAVTCAKEGDVDDENGDEDEFVFEIDDSSVDDSVCEECQGTMDDNDGDIEAASHEVFPSQVIVESLINRYPEKTSIQAGNLPEYQCDDLPDFMFGHADGELPNSDTLGDTPIVLVGDDSSVCLPCETAHGESGAGTGRDQEKGESGAGTGRDQDNATQNEVQLSEEEIAKVREDEKIKKREEEKAKWQLWKSIVGNGIIDRTELTNKITTDLLCLHCIHEQIAFAKNINDIKLEDATVQVKTNTFGFACTVFVKCKRGYHDFRIEPPRVGPQTIQHVGSQSTENNISTNEHIPGTDTQQTNDMVLLSPSHEATPPPTVSPLDTQMQNGTNMPKEAQKATKSPTPSQTVSPPESHMPNVAMMMTQQQTQNVLTTLTQHHSNNEIGAADEAGSIEPRVLHSTAPPTPGSAIGTPRSTNSQQPPNPSTASQGKKRGRPVSTQRIQDYIINYQAYLMMMMFGNGITGLDTMLGMLGIAVHSSSATAWAEIANRLGIAQQKVADACQEQNIENEIKAMQELGITPIM